MSTAIIVIILVFAFIIGGMITLLKTANKYRFPKNYDKSKTGFDDEEDWGSSDEAEPKTRERSPQDKD
ncbi:DUF2897 family protein [Aliikangiella sp. IMCC44653]